MIHSWWMRERLQSLLDGELSEARRGAVAGHLEHCPRCATALQRMSEGDRLLVSNRPIPQTLSHAAAEALLERALAEARVGRGGPWRGMTLLAWGFAALLVIAASGAAAWWRRPDSAAMSDRTRSSRLARRDSDGAGTREIEAVTDHRPFNAGSGDPPSRKPLRPPAVQREQQRHERKSRPTRMAVPTGGEPRPRRSRAPKHRLIATVPSPWRDQLLYPASADDLRAVVGPGLRESAAVSGSPNDGRSAALDENVPDHQIDAKACDQAAVRLVSAALDGDDSAIRWVAEALDELPATGTEVSSPAINTSPDLREWERMTAEWPLPWEGEDPEEYAPPAFLPSPQLLVMVSNAPAPSPVTVTFAPEETPGYARAIACRPDAAGRDTWMQATATSKDNGTQTALVMLGDEVWDW